MKTTRPEPFKSWELHKNAMRDLIMHVLLQGVRDADALARRGRWEHDTGFNKENLGIIRERESRWLNSSRFSFWTEWVDIDSRSAAERTQQILNGELDVSKIYRSDKR